MTFLAGIFLLSTAVTGLQVEPDGSSVTFSAVGKPGFLHINGKDAHVTGKATSGADGLSGVFEVKLDEFHTGIDLRDEHMKTKYLETGKYPVATLKWTIPGASLPGVKEAPFTGTLTLHGVDHPVEGTATVEVGAGGAANVGADFKLKLSDYKIDVPTYLGVTVAEDVSVHAELKASHL